MSAAEQLTGALWLRPGQAPPDNLRSTRPDWVARVAPGLPADRLAGTLGSLFSLCGHAHRACAGMAVQAALGLAVTPDRAQLARETLREHLRRITLDWPRQLGPAPDAPPAVHALARCPAFASAPGDAAGWVEEQLIGMPLASWLAAWEREPAAWLSAWAHRTALDLPRLLHACRPIAGVVSPAVAALRVHADRDELRGFAATLDAPGAARQPRWRGACAQTGVWTRSNDANAPALDSAWLRLGARVAEVVRLALPDAPARSGAGWLGLGALPLAPGEAIAWVEMARGLLIHHVRLDGHGDAARVAACHVIAPTEWNFHPHGAVAHALEALPPDLAGDSRRRLAAWLAAYDPCVPPHVESMSMDDQEREEPAHA